MPHLWPETDKFSGGSPIYGSFVTPYIRLKAWDTDPAYGSGGTGFGLTCAAGQMYDAYFGDQGPPYQYGASPTPCVFTTGTSTTDPVSFAWRRDELLECQVDGSFYVVSQVEEPQGDALRYFGVGARIQDGVAQGSGTTEHYDGLSGYWFLFLADPLLGYKYSLVRVNNGALTRLAETPAGDGVYGEYDDVNRASVFRLRIVVREVSGDPVFECYRFDYLAEQGAANLILSYTDTAGAAIRTAGRTGFLMTPDFSPNGTKRVTHRCVYFQLKDTTLPLSDQLKVEDRWFRNARLGFTFASPFVEVDPGKVLNCEWFTDLNSQGLRLLAPDPGNKDRLIIEASLFPGPPLTEVWIPSLPLRTNSITKKNQDREITFELQGTGTQPDNPRKVGLWLFGSNILLVAAGLPPGQCYSMQVTYDDSTDTSLCELYRHNDIGVFTRLASLALALAFDTEYVIRLSVKTLDMPLDDGTVEIKCYLDAVQLPLVADVIPGITANAAGTVHDSSTDRLIQGSAQGFLVGNDGGTRDIFLDTWAPGGAVLPGSEFDEASIALDSESEGKFGVLDVPLSNVEEIPASVGYREIRFESDHAYRNPRDVNGRRGWSCAMVSATDAERASVEAFFAEHQRGSLAFDWDPSRVGAQVREPVGTLVAVKFDPRQGLRVVKDGPNTWAYEFTLIEVF